MDSMDGQTGSEQIGRRLPRPPVGGSYWGLLVRNGDFRRVYLATLISLAGDWFMMVALYDLVLSQTGSATLTSLISVCLGLPALLVTPWAGTLIDRTDRRRLMVIVDLLRHLGAFGGAVIAAETSGVTTSSPKSWSAVSARSAISSSPRASTNPFG